jgi:hypothetical protein
MLCSLSLLSSCLVLWPATGFQGFLVLSTRLLDRFNRFLDCVEKENLFTEPNRTEPSRTEPVRTGPVRSDIESWLPASQINPWHHDHDSIHDMSFNVR